ncbi:MAG TPA: TonB family protein [Tepidisphaeraceae bacterium]|nr:TonB family protein [Tepidisphaeraceae bacterium]
MRRRDFSLTLALCLSLAIHALLLASTAELYIHSFGTHIQLAAPERPLPPLDPLLQPRYDEDDNNPWNRLGDSNSNGNSTGNSPGDQPMVAQKGMQNQPLLSLDPVGAGQIGDAPTESVLPRGAGEPSAPSPQVEASAPVPEIPFGLQGTDGEFVSPRPAKPASPAVQPSQGQQVQPGASASADPAPQSSTESDPVSTVGGVDFRPGSATVRLGRKYKLTRPHLTLAARADLMTGAQPAVVLKIKIDSTGKVINAEIFRSSGSSSVDQPCKLAAYEWWFEPPKDAAGNPTGDVILFAIRFI